MITLFKDLWYNMYYSFCDDETFIDCYYASIIIQRAYRQYRVNKQSKSTQTSTIIDEYYLV
jgi:hypothetical protein